VNWDQQLSQRLCPGAAWPVLRLRIRTPNWRYACGQRQQRDPDVHRHQVLLGTGIRYFWVAGLGGRMAAAVVVMPVFGRW